jgi:hypothetical protein
MLLFLTDYNHTTAGYNPQSYYLEQTYANFNMETDVHISCQRRLEYGAG